MNNEGLFWWRNQSGKSLRKVGTRVYAINMSKKGMPDIFFAHPDRSGRVIGIEVKTEDGMVSQDQKNCHAELAAWGIPVAIIRSREDLEDVLVDLYMKGFINGN